MLHERIGSVPGGVRSMKADGTCGDFCMFYGFFAGSREAMFVVSRDGLILDANGSLEKLLGYGEGELQGLPVPALLYTEDDHESYERLTAAGDTGPGQGIMIRKKDGTPVVCIMDAVALKDGGEIAGFQVLIRTREEVLDSFARYFNGRQHERRFQRGMVGTMETDKTLLSRYMTTDLVDFLRKNDLNPLETGRREITVLFLEIGNAIPISERSSPREYSAFMNDLFNVVTDLICGCRGSVIRIDWKGVLASFGTPLSTGDDTYNAVDAGVRIRDYLRQLNDMRPASFSDPVRAGIGIATGNVFAGVTGSSRMREYAVIGEPVKIASRLKTLASRSGGHVFIDEYTCRIMRGRIRYMKKRFRRSGKPPLVAYAVTGLK